MISPTLLMERHEGKANTLKGPDIVAEEPPPLSLMPGGVVPVGIHEMEDVEDDVPLLDRVHNKRTCPLVQGSGSSSTVAGVELNTLSIPVMPLIVTPLIIVYLISNDDEP
ncbi:hypothetical protein Tco_0959413 [Tanacetum coccineum]